ncbi:MAG TPA: glutamine-hydrolyzing carbamoyl-phosphate synthase small subunit [Candidatus Saccharimonadia bacterium]|nr:glutamine-hydrolyzing carbamoyl-phosphate synthase small subunit [Candidatus Saccharimonadia bacterium]
MNNPKTTNQVTNTSGRPDGGDFFVTKPGRLVLEGGQSFAGQVPDWHHDGLSGETVFNTGMTGYVETLTDPSYSGQILAFTYPLLGNYGVPDAGTWESQKIHLRGVVVSELTQAWSHVGSLKSLGAWLREQNIPFITGVDTRALTKYLRTRGTMTGLITTADRPRLAGRAPAKVSIEAPRIYNPGKSKTVIAVDCGMKENIIRHLVGLGLTVKRVPHNYDYTADAYDGVFISNGPGDPTDYQEATAILRRALAGTKPVFGICLGAQLMALAAGGSTYKLRFGHRGHNQPAVTPEGRGYITSQNHGYAVAEDSLPADWRVTFRNLNDNSVEGIAHRHKPFFAVQFHPEAAPGPTDTAWLFDEFRKML